MSLSENLLLTRLQPPPLRTHLVNRPNLLAQLEENLQRGCCMTLISAPAGYGKTTLLAEWVRRSGYQAAWYLLNETDNDPARFLQYLLAAVGGILPDHLHGDLEQLSPARPQNLEPALTWLVNRLSRLPGHFMLVLDDYHLIHNDTIHSALAFLLEHQPAQLHLALATRADPPLPLARLRARGMLSELRVDDLRFNQTETTCFLNQVMDLNLPGEITNRLQKRTEGWPAGLQLAASSLKSCDDVQKFTAEFTGSNRYVLDYLVEEVLRRQPERIQQFLYHTAILDRLSSSLCSTLLDLPEGESQKILEYLEHSNLFLFPLDEQRRWYRYHPLFASLLGQRLQHTDPGTIPRLHRRASTWYAEHAYIDESIQHALAAQDYQWAGMLIEKASEGMLMRSEFQTFFGWVSQLPPAERRRHPALCLHHAWALLWNGAPLYLIEDSLESIEASPETSGMAAIIHWLLAIYRGQNDAADRFYEQVRGDMSSLDPFLQELITLMRGISLLSAGDSAAATDILQPLIQKQHPRGNVLIPSMVLFELAEFNLKQGKLHQAESLYRQVLDMAEDGSGKRLPAAGKALIGLGELAREWDDLETAEKYLQEGITLSSQWSQLSAFSGYLSLAKLRMAQGDPTGVETIFAELRRIAGQFDIMDVDDQMVEMAETRFQLALGSLEAPRRWAARYHLLDTVPGEEDIQILAETHVRIRKYTYPLLARLYLAEGKPDDALAILDPLLSYIRDMDRPMLMIDTEINRSLAFQAKGDTRTALASLRHALALAQPEGLVQTFICEKGLRGLLELTRQDEQDTSLLAYIDLLLGRMQLRMEAGSVQPTRPAGLAEPLTAREMEVLRLLPGSLSLDGIARELVISIHTVRSHLKNLYGKLDAHSRNEAVAQARKHNLL